LRALCSAHLLQKGAPPRGQADRPNLIVLAGSSDGRVSAHLLLDGGRDIKDVGLVWRDPDRLSVSRIQLVEQTAEGGGGGKGLTCRFLLAKASFVVAVAVRLVQKSGAGQWKIAEAVTQGSVIAGTGTVVGMELDNEGGVLVAAQKGPPLR
jgi:hypothetical protein